MKRTTWILAILALFAAATLLAAPWAGMHNVPFRTILERSTDSPEAAIFWRLRVPRVLTSFLAGAALAACGMAFQAMFRNALATPYTLGISSGASLGAVLCMRFGLAGSLWIFSSVAGFAFLGALVSVGVVYGLARMRGEFSTFTLLLAGVALNAFFASLILFIQYTANVQDSFRLMRWLMGGISPTGFDTPAALAPFVLAAALVLALLTRELDLLAAGEDIALSRGVEVRRTQHWIFAAASLAVGGVVSVCGPIGFVGLMAPHICRLLVGHNHARLLPACLLLGGAFLTLCDTLARVLAAPAEIPVGVITALLGGPFFLWLLIGAKPERVRL